MLKARGLDGQEINLDHTRDEVAVAAVHVSFRATEQAVERFIEVYRDLDHGRFAHQIMLGVEFIDGHMHLYGHQPEAVTQVLQTASEDTVRKFTEALVDAGASECRDASNVMIELVGAEITTVPATTIPTVSRHTWWFSGDLEIELFSSNIHKNGKDVGPFREWYRK